MCLTAEVFFFVELIDHFRVLCMTYYGLDPVHYDKKPNVAFALYHMLLMMLVVQLTYDQNMYEMD